MRFLFDRKTNKIISKEEVLGMDFTKIRRIQGHLLFGIAHRIRGAMVFLLRSAKESAPHR